MTVQRMDNVDIVVESLDAAISFFTELGLELEERAMIEGEWAGRSPDSARLPRGLRGAVGGATRFASSGMAP